MMRPSSLVCTGRGGHCRFDMIDLFLALSLVCFLSADAAVLSLRVASGRGVNEEMNKPAMKSSCRSLDSSSSVRWLRVVSGISGVAKSTVLEHGMDTNNIEDSIEVETETATCREKDCARGFNHASYD